MILAIVGPTGVGKTKLSIELAKRLTISIEELEKAHVSSFNKKVLTNLAYTEFTGEVDDKDVATAEDRKEEAPDEEKKNPRKTRKSWI